MKIRCVLALVCAAALAAVSAWAAETPAATAATTTASAPKASEEKAAVEKGPVRVEVGTYVNHILALDLKGNQFTADFYIWFRWKGDLKPFDTFDLANGRITSRTGVVKKELDGGVHYASARIVATITKFWDLRRYPLDDHHLTLEIEDNENEDSLLVYVPDTRNSAASPSVQVPGWIVTGTSASVISHKYATNYGDTSVPTGNASSYSRFVSGVQIVRPGIVGRFFKLFFTLFVATIISWLAFWVRPKDAGPRVSLCVGSVFAAAAATFAINTMLPDTNATTMSDRVIVASLSLILASALETMVAMNLGYAGKENAQRRLDRLSAWVFPLAYIALLVIYVI
ncbi:MAG TPA: hypothetical protein VLC46_15240 [Thermoanaerobaculia bacterium]|jgi:hypothetical protein|nr:hypothetical protein [Thermoanaerobaculia bacterium]